MNRNLLAVVVILLVVGIGGYLAFFGVGGFLAHRAYQPTSEPTPQTTTPTDGPTPESTSEATISDGMVSVTASGFEPKAITIKAGETVTWTNKDTKTHNISSVPHPTHTTYPPLNLGNFMAEKTVTLTFPTKGTYMYHNHLFPTLFGSVVVE